MEKLISRVCACGHAHGPICDVDFPFPTRIPIILKELFVHANQAPKKHSTNV